MANLQTLDLSFHDGKIVYNPPNDNIYEFIGYFETIESDLKTHKEPLNLDSTMWANTILTSGKIIGMVIYVGSETRIAKNSRKPRTKIGIIKSQIKLNYVL